MKARLPALSSNQRAKAIAEVEKMVKEEMTKQSEQIVRRNMKLMCHALNEFFGFGKHRLSKLISEIGKLSAEADTDEIFWEHIDRVDIDYLGLPFEREQEG